MVELRLDIAGEPLIAASPPMPSPPSTSRSVTRVTALIKAAAFDRLSFGAESSAGRARARGPARPHS